MPTNTTDFEDTLQDMFDDAEEEDTEQEASGDDSDDGEE
jgi:hypothetical protein